MSRRETAVYCTVGIFLALLTTGCEGRTEARPKLPPETATIRPAGEDPNGQPILRLEKAEYVLGEDIRFWVGVEAKGSIPEEYWGTCILHITLPDGSVQEDPVGWPRDGALGRGWRGGWRLGTRVMPGTYTLMFEFARQKALPERLVVKELPLLRQIRARFVFERTGQIEKDVDVPVILVVENESRETIRFPRLNVHGCGGVEVYVEREHPPSRFSFFYPHDKLRMPDETEPSKISIDMFCWDVIARVRTVTLGPGESFTQELSVRDAYELREPGRYTVSFRTTLQLLIGEPEGQYAKVCPVRLPVTARETFTVVDSGVEDAN